MATITQKKRDIKYLNRDFDGLKKDFLQHLKIYFPDTVNDFNESSAGMLLTELAAFIGDNMSFYIDKRFNESFIETAVESSNVLRHAKQLGFKPFGKTAAAGTVDAFIKVPAITVNQEIIPDIKYIRPYNFLPKISFQLLDIIERKKRKIGDPIGFCALWSIWYVDNRIKYKEITDD